MSRFLMTRRLLLFGLMATALIVRASSAATYIVVLEPSKSAGEPFDVEKAGGELLHKAGNRLAVTLPEQAVEGIRRNPSVRYVQKLVTGAPERQKERGFATSTTSAADF